MFPSSLTSNDLLFFSNSKVIFNITEGNLSQLTDFIPTSFRANKNSLISSDLVS